MVHFLYRNTCIKSPKLFAHPKSLILKRLQHRFISINNKCNYTIKLCGKLDFQMLNKNLSSTSLFLLFWDEISKFDLVNPPGRFLGPTGTEKSGWGLKWTKYDKTGQQNKTFFFMFTYNRTPTALQNNSTRTYRCKWQKTQLTCAGNKTANQITRWPIYNYRKKEQQIWDLY